MKRSAIDSLNGCNVSTANKNNKIKSVGCYASHKMSV